MKAPPRVGVVDAGIGTWTSIINMLSHMGLSAHRANSTESLESFSHLILPGVGNFQSATIVLEKEGWKDAVLDYAQTGKPVLGVCLGMQLLGIGSEEGAGSGLGLLNFSASALSQGGPRRVPNFGWARLEPQIEHPLLSDFEPDARFYFVHSYAVPSTSDDSIATSMHNDKFSSVVGKDNVLGVQFHPEKSHRFGMKLFENFVGQ